MIKCRELADPKSCLSKARDDQMIFVLIETDEDAPGAIRDWIARRIRSGKNKPGDAKLIEAEACATAMERRRAAGQPTADSRVIRAAKDRLIGLLLWSEEDAHQAIRRAAMHRRITKAAVAQEVLNSRDVLVPLLLNEMEGATK